MAERKLTWVAEFKDMATDKIQGVNDKLTGVSGAAGKLGKSMTDLGSSLTKKVSVPLAGVGVASIHTVSNFDDGMSRVKGLTNATGDQFDELREKAIELGQTTAYSATDAAEGMQILAASGMGVNDIMETSGDMFTLMSAGAVEADTAASVLTNTMAQFGLETSDSSRIVDVFSQGAASAKLGVEDLEYIMGQAGGTMASMNMDMEQSVAMAGQLADAGMPIGQVGSAINAMGREVKANADAFRQHGIEVYDEATGKMKDMGTVMGELEGQLQGKTDAQRDEILSSMFSGQAMKGAIDWLSLGSEHYAGLTDEIYGATGAGEKFAEENENNIGGALRSMASSIETLMIRVGDVLAPSIGKAADFVAKLADKFSGLSPEMQSIAVKIGVLATAAGPLMSVGGHILTGLGKFAGFVGLPGLLIGAIVAGFTVLYNTSDEFRERVGGFMDFMSEAFGGAVELVGSVVGAVSDRLSQFISESTFMDSVQVAFEGVMTAVEGITNIFSIAVDFISEIWNATGDNLVNIAGTAMEFITETIGLGLEVVGGLLEVFGSVLQGDWNGAWEGVKGIVTNFIDWFKGIPAQILEVAKNIGSAVSEGLKAAGNWAWDNTVGRVTGGRKNRRIGQNTVPYDNYPANLHRGEMVLTASAAKDWKDAGGNKSRAPKANSPVRASSSNKVVYSPNIHIEVNDGNQETSREFERRIERVLERERKIFLAKLELQGV